MNNTRSRGQAFVRRCKAVLEKEGYEVAVFGYSTLHLPGGQIISKRNDPFGCDVVAIRGDAATLWVQCTLHSGTGKRLKEFLSHPFPGSDCVQLWQGKENGEIVIQELKEGAFQPVGMVRRGKMWNVGRAI